MIDISSYDKFLSLISSFQDSKQLNNLIIKILELISDISNSDGCFFYKITSSKYLNLEYINIKSLRLNLNGSSCDKIFSPIFIPDIKNKKFKTPLEICATSKDIINTPNIHNEPLFDTSYLKKFDLENSYNSVSLLAFPLFDSNNNIISIIQFLNPQTSDGKIINYTQDIQKTIISMCQLISVILEKQQQETIYNKFLESLISTIAKIVLSKTPHIAAQNKHVPIISQILAIAIDSSTDPHFKNFEMTDNDWNILNITAWLYDCGKIIAPDYIMNKTSKLETVNNRIHEIRNRFEILRRDAHIEYLQKRLNKVADKETLQAEFVEKVKKLHEDFDFVGLCNNDSISLKEEDISRLEKISSQTFTRYFNRLTGLSPKELQNIDTKIASNPELEHLLQDRPEQISDMYNKGELSNLKTQTDFLNKEERHKIQEHVLNTSYLLSDIPFPKEYSDIVEIIATYKKIIEENKIPQTDKSKTTTFAKIISLASVFSSLISKETPYSKSKKLSQIMKTMQKMKNDGLIDPDIYNIFIKNNIYIDYAKEYLDTSQIDEINIEEII